MLRTLLFALLLSLGIACDSKQDFSGEGAPASERASFALPGFELTERSGETVSKESLLGAPWIAGFAFTNCAGPCPRLSGVMASLQQELADTPVKLVTVSVDPERDTPEVLQVYAQSFGADPERWLFLTGEKEAIHELVRDGFRLGVQENAGALPGEAVTHSTRLALVDSEGVIQGFFGSEDREAVERLVARAKTLAEEAR